MRARSLYAATVIGLSFLLTACNPFINQERTHRVVIPGLPTLEAPKPVIPAIVNVKITDPAVKRILGVTDHVSLVALGKLKPGTFTVNGRSIMIKEPTSFKLQISMPIDNPSELSTKRASGSLWTSEELVFMGLPLPKTIELKDGKATSNVDLLRLLSMYFVNVLDSQSESSKNADLRSILDVLVIKHATMHLTPGASFKFEKKKLHLARNSTVEMRDLALDGDLNYKGTFITNLNFLADNDWIGEKVDVLFNGGRANLKLQATRTNGNVRLKLAGHDANVLLKDCLFKFGKNKRSSAHVASVAMPARELTWSKPEGAEKSNMHLVTPMNLVDTKVSVKTDTQQTAARFPGTAPALLTVDITPPTRRNTFTTLNPETASYCQVNIHRPKTKLKLDLTNASVDRIAWSKQGDLELNLSRGTAQLNSVYWTTGEKSFTLKSKGHSILSLPQGMVLNLSSRPSQTEMVLPITVKMGSAVLGGSSGTFALSDLNGKLLVTCDPDVQLKSDMEFTIDRSKLLGDERVRIKAKGLDIFQEKGHASAKINSVSMTVSEDALREAILKRIPKEKVFQLNKVLAERKWRYRNFKVENLYVRNVTIDEMKLSEPNTFEFTVRGDLEAAGTVEKGGLLSMFKSELEDAETKPWRATAQVAGKGTVKYRMVPNESLGDSELLYEVSLDLPVRENVEVDWSQVNDGLFKNTEREAIVKNITELNMPINFDGKLNAFENTADKWDFMRVKDLIVLPSTSGTEVRFRAEAIL